MIKTSFKKKENAATKDSNYFYFGSPDIDGIFSNQLMRGTIMLVEEDYPTKHYLSLLRFYVGCGLHMNQKVFIYDLLPNRWQKLIPTAKDPNKAETAEEKAKNAEKSKIAWRYDSMDIKLKEQNANKDIPLLDLAKNLDIEKPEFKEKGLLHFQTPKEVTNFKELFESIYQTLQDALNDSNDKTIKRFVFPNFFTTFCQLNKDNKEVIKFFHTLKVFARSTYCTFMFSFKTEDEAFRQNARFIFDYVIGLEVLKNNEEFEDFQGFVRLVKVPSLNKYVSHPHDTKIFGFKAGKKKFEVEKLYSNPEKESTNFDGTRYDGPIMCSTKPGDKDKLDF